MKNIEKILSLSQKRIAYFLHSENVKNWYQWSETYFDGVIKETIEAKDENCEKNHIFLEDELGDIFWNYCCLLASLEEEGKISSREQVFKRCLQKFIARVGENANGGHNWDEVKKWQKEALLAEHKNFYE